LINLAAASKNVLGLALKSAGSLARLGDNGSHALEFPIEFRPLGYRIDVPWYSALSQALSASAFWRVHVLTGDSQWLGYSAKSLNSITERPGLARSDMKSNGMWFEEYPAVRPLHVLNGHIYCCIAFYELSRTLDNNDYTNLFQKGVNALSSSIDVFDCNGLTYYDAVRKILAKPYYQRLHVKLLQYLFSITGNELLLGYSRKWEQGFRTKWGIRSWSNYTKQTVINGLRVEGAAFPINALSYALGDLGPSL
jgi:hypothetical protein